MANEDKDRKASTLGGTTPGAAAPGAATSGSSASIRNSGVTGSDMRPGTSATSASMSGMPGSTVGNVQSGTQSQSGSGQRMAEDAKHYAKDVADQAKEQGKSLLEQQKDTAARQVDSAAHALRATGEQLQDEGQTQVGRYVQKFASQLESFSGQLRHKNLDALVRDAEDLGRRSPATLFAGSLLAGFALTRFLKSSAEHQHDSGSARYSRGNSAARDDSAEYAARLYGADRDSSDMNAAYGSATAGGRGVDIDSGRSGLSGSALDGSAVTGDSPSAAAGSSGMSSASGTPSITNPNQPGGGNYGKR